MLFTMGCAFPPADDAMPIPLSQRPGESIGDVVKRMGSRVGGIQSDP